MNDIRNNYNRDGYVLLKSFFNKEQVDDLKEDAKKVFIRQMHKQGILSSLNPDEKTFETAMYQFFKQDTEGYINCSKTCQYLVSFYKFALDEKLLEYVNRLGVKEPSINTRPVMNLSSKHLAKSEVYYKVPAHQDWRTGQGSLNAITIWVPLVDVDIKLGALEVIPRSHLWGLYDTVQDDLFRHIEVEGIDEEPFVPVQMKAGDALFFSAFLIHKSGDNVTDSIRWSLHIRFNDLSEPTFIERKYPYPYTYKPQQELITAGFPEKSLLEKFFS